MPPSVHDLRPADVYAVLGTRPEGLTEAEGRERLARHGPNALQEIRGPSLAARLLGQFTHLMALLLWAGGAVAFAARLPQLGIAVWAVVLLNGVFSFWQEYRAEKAVQALRRILPPAARVVREGEERRIPADRVVPGDVLRLAEGDRVPADARVVSESGLRADQSVLTGESHPARKTADAVPGPLPPVAERANLVFAGTGVAAGNATAVVFATGMGTAFGAIARLTQSVEERESPLQNEMRRATRIVTAIAVGAGVLFFGLAVLLARMDPAAGFVFALGMIVAFVPEGLLPTVTLALAMGVQRLARRRALVKRLSAVETLGCASVICTDKTGTLTENEMTVTRLLAAGRALSVTGAGYDPLGEVREGDAPAPEAALRDAALLLRAAALCSNARLLPPDPSSPRWAVLGDPTEGALLVAARKAGVDLEAERILAPRLREIPFDSRRKRMATVHGGPGGRTVYMKGAPADVLARCATLREAEGERPLRPGDRDALRTAVDGLAREGLRVLAVARRTLPDEVDPADTDAVERDLELLGLAAMADPPRPEVAEAVSRCRSAGIRIVMVTGDHGLTAEAIARRVGIVRAGGVRILNGPELDAMDDAALRGALRGEVVLARASPEHKLRVVVALQAEGHVVAATGDGVNDAPILRKADIGIAMGVSGADVAREAADMILADDNFATIVNAVEEGRAVYANIRKFIGYIFTSNAPEAVPFVLYALSGGRIPPALNVMQILSIDLGTDIAPALALGVEPPEPGLMEHPPRKRSEHAITLPLLLRAYAFLGLLQSAAAMAAFYLAYRMNGYGGRLLDLPGEGAVYRQATAMTLAAVVCTQAGNLFAQRTERASVLRAGFFRNRMAFAGIAAGAVLLLLIVYVPFLQDVFGTSGIPLAAWPFLLGTTPLLLAADEARKALVRRRKARGSPGGGP